MSTTLPLEGVGLVSNSPREIFVLQHLCSIGLISRGERALS
jgi:hypothetical protein